MTVEEIRECAINSCEVYLQYLKDNDKGIQIVEIRSIEPVDDRKVSFKLKIAQRLFDLDAIVFKFLTTNKEYDTAAIKVIHYDRDQRSLIVKPEPELRGEFSRLLPNEIKVISDLKFLIERVKGWYMRNGNNIALPTSPSSLKGTEKDIAYFPGLVPSENQKNALCTILNESFSYIWGAPGTGKTQIVLSYALLHYLREGKRVAILAPTNNAVEQVLRGVIGMTDRAGIDREDILRLGNPTKKFAELYPEVCEVSGLEKQLKEIDEQLQLLAQISENQKELSDLEKARQSLEQFDELALLAKKEKQYKAISDDAQSKLVQLKNELYGNESELGKLYKQQAILQRKKESFFHSLGKIFSSGASKTERQLEQTTANINSLLAKLPLLKVKIASSEKEQAEIASLEKGIAEKSSIIISNIKSFVGVKGGITIVEDLRLINQEEVKASLLQFLTIKEEGLKEIASLASDYSLFPGAIADRIKVLTAERERIAAQSTEERLKKVKVVACTLDTYISRFHETKMEVDHIFLDEAGYANIIKALTLFHHQLPITFLGDHLQLPPVCELNQQDIQNDEKNHDVFLWSQSALFLEELFQLDKSTVLTRYLKHSQLNPQSMVKADINETFRFGTSLAQVLNQYVYKNGFCSATGDGKTSIFYLNAIHQPTNQKRLNTSEINRIAELVSNLDDQDVAILTPYNNQKYHLGKRLTTLRNDDRILSVHGSQGKEWHTVILSVVDTHQMWFTDTTNPRSNGLNLINTAVSRAKERLIIVCDHSFWVNQPTQLIGGLLQVATPFPIGSPTPFTQV